MLTGVLRVCLLLSFFPVVCGATCLSPVVLWSTAYDSPAQEADVVHSLAVDGNGDVVVVGWESRSDLGVTASWRIRKYGSDGMLVWSAYYHSPSTGLEFPNDVAVDGSGNVVVVGGEFRSDLGQSYNWRIRKYDSNGALLWSKDYNSPANDLDQASGVAVDSGGNIVVVGGEKRTDLGQDQNWLIRKYDSNGTLLWSKDYDSPAQNLDFAVKVALGASGNIVVVGYETRLDLGQGENWLIRKYDSDGLLLWSRDYNAPANGDDRPSRVAIDGDGNIVVVGGEDRVDLGQGRNWLIRKYDSDGLLLWSTDYNSLVNGDDGANGLAVDSGGNIVVVGDEDRSDIGQAANWHIQKYDPTGLLLWSQDYDSPNNSDDSASGVGIDGSGNVVVGGLETRDDLAQSANWRIRKYDQAYLEGILAVSPSPAYPGQSLTVTLTITNTGSVTVPGTTPSLGVNAGASLITFVSGPIPTGPATLAAGASQMFVWTYSVTGIGNIGFTGTAAGMASGSPCVYVSASVTLASLTIPPPSLPTNLTAVARETTIELAWDVSTPGANAISGYNVYWATYPGFSVSSGTFLTQVPGPTTTVFSDAGVTRGALYCYRIRGVDINNLESGNSNEACATIPLPTSPPYTGLMRVFPNPFNPATAIRGTVKFEGLPVGTKVRLYTVRGLKVWEGEVVTPNLVEWDGRSEGGKRAAPGTYLWVTEGEGKKERGTLIVE